MIAEEYVDNDVSAYSGKPRPAYARMVTDLAAGVRDAVILYNLDRLHRRPVELEEFVALCERAGVRDVATMTADIDLGNDDGLFMARIFAAFAAKESGRRSARIRRKMIANAEACLPHGPQRPFGYDDDKVTGRPAEAAIITTLVARFLAGESLRSLAGWLNDTGVPTVRGGQRWSSTTLLRMLPSGRIAGLREHRGQVIGPAIWPAIWPAIITPPNATRSRRRSPPAPCPAGAPPAPTCSPGMLRCGKCGNRLFSAARQSTLADGTLTRTRRYVCLGGPDHGGCGRLTVVAVPVEELITEAVLTRLDSPALADALAGRVQADTALSTVAEALSVDQARLGELAGLYGDGQVTAREWITARDPINARIRDAERHLARAADTGPLHTLAGHAIALRTQWDTAGLDRQKAIVRAVLDHAVIGPGNLGARTLDINRVQPHWRF